MSYAGRPYANPDSPGNVIRPDVRCLGCGCLGCITTWGDWCFKCNVERMDGIDASLEKLRHSLRLSAYDTAGLSDPKNLKALRNSGDRR